MTTAPRAPVLLIHGAWHSAACWDRVIPPLLEQGHQAVALDLPGHGVNARYPAAFVTRPPDRSLAATEPSPVAAVTLDDYVDAVVETINALVPGEGAQVAVVAHSMGGLVATAVAEQVPHLVSKLIYLAGFMPSSGIPGRTYIGSEENDGDLVRPNLLADPAKVGAMRMDHATDTSHRAFCSDLSRAEYDEIIAAKVSPDAPAKPFVTPITTTPQRWGSIPRYYIKALRDMALRPPLQQRFIDEADAAVPDNPTRIHELDTSHSPFASQPAALVSLLSKILDE